MQLSVWTETLDTRYWVSQLLAAVTFRIHVEVQVKCSIL